VAALFGSLATRGNAAAPTTTTTTTTIGQAPAHADDCQGGAEDRVTVKLEPDTIVRGRGGERLGIGVHVHPHFESDAAIVGAVEVIDDRGQRIGATQSLEVRRLAAKAPTSYRVETPEGLRDGYYRVQVSLLARSGAAEVTEALSTHQLYFNVAQGSLTPVSHEEWMTKSQAGLAFQVR
jgi:hypothetical protein